jgi:hypothetical protein
MNGRFQLGGKNRFLPKEMTANRFFWDSHWLEILSNHLCPSMGPNGGIVAMDSALEFRKMTYRGLADSGLQQAGIGQAPVSHLPQFVDAVR